MCTYIYPYLINLRNSFDTRGKCKSINVPFCIATNCKKMQKHSCYNFISCFDIL